MTGAPGPVDVYVDLTYGVLLCLGVGSQVLYGSSTAALAFTVGLTLGYAVHVGWRMSRFDPDDVGDVVEETVEDVVDDEVLDRHDE